MAEDVYVDNSEKKIPGAEMKLGISCPKCGQPLVYVLEFAEEVDCFIECPNCKTKYDLVERGEGARATPGLSVTIKGGD